MNWFVKTWTTPLINREDNNSDSDRHEVVDNSWKTVSEQTSQERTPGMFDWFWGTPEEDEQVQQNTCKQLGTSEALDMQGDDEFVEKITRAYNYLDDEDKDFVKANTSRIMQHERVSGAFPISKIVMLGGEVLSRDEKCIAGVLVHEAKHNTNGAVANSQEEELECIQKQIETLRKIGGCETEIAWLEKEDGLHYRD